jgi:NitT/TauT family transport system ATP-binding protein
MNGAGGVALRDVGLVFTPPRREPVVALDGVTLDIDAGRFVSVVGASGSGKSTLLRLVHGLLPPTTGGVFVDGTPVSGPAQNRAMVFQSDCLLPWATVLDNVAYGLRLAGTPKREARATAAQRLAAVGLADVEAAYPRQLSGGMRQRVNIARALAVDPRVLLLDEPFAALDAQTREIMSAELLRIWTADRKTVLFITHQIDEAVYLADQVVVLSARPGTVREVIDVDLPRPRDLSVKRTPEFGRIVDHIWGLIEHEVRRSLGLPTPA